jgi:membrane protein implicated in regulation of membrane protease activity
MWQLWLLVCLLCLILELTSGDFFIMCFSLGALAALVATPFTGFVGQLVVWMLGTVLCLLFVRPVMLKYFHKKTVTDPAMPMP